MLRQNTKGAFFRSTKGAKVIQPAAPPQKRMQSDYLAPKVRSRRGMENKIFNGALNSPPLLRRVEARRPLTRFPAALPQAVLLRTFGAGEKSREED